MPQPQNHYNRKEILQYLNHDLFIDNMIAVEKHLEDCNVCSKLAIELKAQSNEQERDRLFEEETERIRAVQIASKTNQNYTRVLLFIAAAIVLVGIGWMFRNKISEVMSGSGDNSLIVEESLDDPEEFTKAAMVDSILLVEEVDSSGLGIEEEQVNSSNMQNNEPINGEVGIQPIEEELLKNDQESEQVLIVSDPNQQEKSEVEDVENRPVQDSIFQRDLSTGYIKVTALGADQPTPEAGYSNLNQFIATNFNYPENALNNNVSGEIEVTLSVSVNDEITDIQLHNSLSQECDQLVKNILRNGPEWKPYVDSTFVERRSARVNFSFTIE